MAYPLPSFKFRIDWGGTNIGFTEVSGLNLETQVIEYREGSSPDSSMIKMPGIQKYSNITLKRGTTKADNELFQWFNTVSYNTIERRSLTISLLDENNAPTVTWKVRNAWPTKVDGGSLKSTDNQVLIESIELAHEGIKVENQ